MLQGENFVGDMDESHRLSYVFECSRASSWINGEAYKSLMQKGE